ncbi:MAG: radical SAM protein [Patescibacteria group bacterium]|nr:radical SAM protein [Patescibacteria group bacterium]
MSGIVLKNAQVILNAVDLSNRVKQVSITYKSTPLDNTAMGNNTKSSMGGLLEWAMSIDFFQDFTAAEVDATLFPLIGTTCTIDVKPVNGARSATNPSYYATALVESYEPIAGSVGQEAMSKVSLVPGEGVLGLQRLIV